MSHGGCSSGGRQRPPRFTSFSGTVTNTAIAAYVAKYATKAADGTPWLAHPIIRLVREAWVLRQHKNLRHLRLRHHAHTLGYTGQFSTK
jgi:hypothetical protein